ncbi:hypothetical protein ASPZODRAFT_13253 [Penicilliopsis zonata CBS 506.65]|uniref:Vacuolar fusion protein MON1 n=1 Tax=Penicilliopsis zonata CBS 506.65 TaxID=1073090 RepID=A0A1L9SSR3_9EURO|nr:hypothetical protein ASPZODRAFT_13253 [Penicilliopsis zonata CBS 506.65]OJJ50163.1 hypothetical protein ASPZODRAFT_13253 [Penicilliopsis zonata CBS 506.65]
MDPPNDDHGTPELSEELRDRSSSERQSPAPTSRNRSVSPEGPRPPLPPRPDSLNLLADESASARAAGSAVPENLQGKATTAVSLTEISSQPNTDGVREVSAGAGLRSLPESLRVKASLSQPSSSRVSEAGDSASIRSFAPGSEAGQVEDLFGDFSGTEAGSQRSDAASLLEFPGLRDDSVDQFLREFDPVGELNEDGSNEDIILARWKAKRKHYLILSAAGKPIWTRHGEGGLISSYIGIIQTIISFYEGSDDHLQSFSAGDTKFVVVTRGPLHLVAISRMLESESQLKLQLEALYMQILSTLTLPSLTHLFSIRPSTDLKRPLQGSETLLSTLADSFTKGSPSTLLSALECLRIRKAHRQAINNALMKTRVKSLLYGLVVAGGRLVSVVRPKKHSLHPGDLQLLFNMIFEAEGVKAGGGESWIPVCLPGFNSSGYLYMYVSFLDLRSETATIADEAATKEDSVAIILISADKESFFELQEMRNAFVEQMEKNESIKIIKAAIEKGRPIVGDIVPGIPLHHFIYKSRANVQFTASSYEPEFSEVSKRQRLMSVYNNLHAGVHSKHTHIKIHHCASQFASSFAWVTPLFEFYCVSGPSASRNALAQSASKIVQWVQREEERLFIIGGAIF